MNATFLPLRYRSLSLAEFVVVSGIAILGVVTTAPARADSDDDALNTSTASNDGTPIVIGVIPELSPAYVGAKKEKVGAIPYIKADGLLDGYVDISAGRGVAVNALRLGTLKAGIALGFGFGRRVSDDPRLRGLKNISIAARPDAFISYDIGPLSFAFDLKERLGNNSGAEAILSARYSFSPLEDLRISVGPSISFANKKYNQAFFGVTKSEAVQAAAQHNPLRVYSPNGGIKDAGLSMSAFYNLDEDWTLGALFSVSELLGKDAQSPLTQRRLQPEMGLAALYKF